MPAPARPTARVLALLEILQAAGLHTVARLAERLEVDERTVRRYVAHLADLDVPVQSVRGRHGGYRLAPGSRLPPLMFSDDEALAVLLGLTLDRRSALPEAAAGATAKLRRVLPVALVRRLDAIGSTLDATGAERPGVPPAVADLLLIAEAARDRRPVVVDHTSRDGHRSERTLHPYGIVAHRGRWYVAAGDERDDEPRTFRLDRIAHPSVRPGSFDVPAGFDAAAHVLAGLAATPWRYEVVLRVEGATDEVAAAFPPGLVSVDDVPDDDAWVRVRLRAERLDWVPALLAGLGRRFVVVAPDELRDRVRELAAQLAAAADPA